MVQTRHIWSAGGVLVRQNELGNCEVVICGRRTGNHWALPKGRPDGDETCEAAAIREVTEETGIVPQIEAELGEVHYLFEREFPSADGETSEVVLFDKMVVFF